MWCTCTWGSNHTTCSSSFPGARSATCADCCVQDFSFRLPSARALPHTERGSPRYELLVCGPREVAQAGSAVVCCTSYEKCVQCCMAKAADQPHDTVATRFDRCREQCRTRGESTSHQKHFLLPATHHCYGRALVLPPGSSSTATLAGAHPGRITSPTPSPSPSLSSGIAADTSPRNNDIIY